MENEESKGDDDQLERLARYIALNGQLEVKRLLAIAKRAMQMLADPTFEASILSDEMAGRRKPFAWEIENEDLSQVPTTICLASTDDYATGEGLTHYFAAGFARSDGEFRRKLSHEWGPALADRARISYGPDADVPFADLFISSGLRSALHKMEHGDDGPASFSFFARNHANYS